MARTLLSLYPRPADRYDELLAPGGTVRAHWQAFFERLDASSPEQLQESQEFAQRRIQENGITYNVYADPKGADRPWALDVLPLVLPAAEWQQIGRAVAQRARLLDRVLADLYGPQDLLAEGLLPPGLVFGHGGYLWPCRGVTPPGGRYLHLYAADLARSPDGRWWVINDRSQSPSGAGYALENRLIVSRIFPELFREMEIQHLAGFFRALQESLASGAAGDPGEAPLVVLLTPGPYNETYFEHAYLARYLGYPLVEGQDLTVRGNRVFLKTLAGLKRVHAILRRLDDDYCDPLELRSDSSLGIPGLLDAVRAGQVLVANALGSGVLESTGLHGFLPAIAERLLGEPLAMPSVATWWCGEAAALDYVIAHLDELVLKPAWPGGTAGGAVFGHRLEGSERDAFLARLRREPAAWVGQELVHLSQAPVLARGLGRRLVGRSFGLRVYAVATADGGYAVMPGGLSRVGGDASEDVISMQRGGSSKDTWVVADGPVNSFSLLKPVLGLRDVVRATAHLPSRSVENLFWFARYTERCENTARLLRIALARLVEEGNDETAALAQAVRLCEKLAVLPPAAAAEPAAPDGPHGASPEGGVGSVVATRSRKRAERQAANGVEARLLAGVFDAHWSGSVLAVARCQAWAASHVRERLSVDHWHAVNRLQDAVRWPEGRRLRLDQALSVLDRVLLACTTLAGYALDDMLRDAGWRFLVIGRRIERLQFLAAAVAGFLDDCQGAPAGIECLLELADSADAFRTRYQRPPEMLPALDLVVFDDANPHAVLLQADLLQGYLERLQRDLPQSPDGSALRVAMRAVADFDLALLEPASGRQAGLACPGDCGPCRDLAQRLRALSAAAAGLSDQLAHTHFAHVGDAGRQTVLA